MIVKDQSKHRKEIQEENRDKQWGADENIFLKKLFMISERWRFSEVILQAEEN